MNHEQKSFPVKYMVTEGRLWPYYNILDTSYSGGGNNIVAKVVELETAHFLAKHLNESEGYEYGY